jgi:small subunit ribosomal protein S6
MNNYSLTVLVKEKIDDKARTALFDDVKKSFGNLTREDLWGVRSLAYEIKHADKAFFAYFEFESEPQDVITLDKNIRLNEDIIRYLLIKGKKAKKAGPGRVKKVDGKEEVKVKSGKETESAEAETKTEETKEKPKKKVVQIRSKKKE